MLSARPNPSTTNPGSSRSGCASAAPHSARAINSANPAA